jgi:EAL domain-containing protein (putative c-di-GMP-specific phosphodiesterase class I)
MTVKVPAVLVEQDDFVAEVQGALRENALPAEMLELEVKESVLLRQPPVRGTPVAETLRKLAELGVGLALDDFGGGVIPLRQLRTLPIGSLKLSPTLTAGLSTEPAEHALVRALVDLGHSLQRRVVAKGVESADQFRALVALGCDEVQGFHFAPPLPPEDLHRWLTGRAANRTLGTTVQ